MAINSRDRLILLFTFTQLCWITVPNDTGVLFHLPISIETCFIALLSRRKSTISMELRAFLNNIEDVKNKAWSEWSITKDSVL